MCVLRPRVLTFHFAIAVGASQQFTRGSSPGAAAAKPRRLAAARSAPGATHVAAFAVAGDEQGRARMSKDAERAHAEADDETNTDITSSSTRTLIQKFPLAKQVDQSKR